ncbi:MAG: hypothetical protein A2V77_14635 [Anaeromyxobacter sp. RBG_16_69_14]|nr:MAG: hypothetical protein A2V77_14635 [Anaeromyxobacter sp. RBG_16_69_14]
MDRPTRSPPRPSPATTAERGPTAPVAQAAGAVLLALSRAARSFVLYDPGNALVRQFLADYQAKMRAALDQYGELAIEVRPIDMLVQGEVVYHDADREKSLSFRLFRDGLRRLTILPHATWEEQLKLLEILAVRYSGVRQQEDDTVTLLRRVGFRGIAVVAVEGFTPAEETPEPALDERVGRTGRFRPPVGWDTPLRKLPAPGPLAFREVADESLAPLRAEDGEGAVAELVLSLARDLVQEAMRAGWPRSDLVAFFAELRDALLADGELGSLRRLVDLLGEVGGGELREEMLRGLGDARTLDLVLAAVPEDAARLPPDLLPFLPLLGIDAALEQLAGNPGEGRRRLLTQIVLARLPREADAVLRRLPALDARLARDLGRGIVARAPERTNEVVRQFLAQADEELRLEGLAALESAPGEVPLQPLCELLRDTSEPVRARAAEVLGRRGDESVLDALRGALEGSREISPGEAEKLGRALAEVAPIAAARLFAGWLEPKARFLRGLSPQQRAQQWAAVAGTGALPGTDPEPILSALAERSEDELRRHCLATLARRRKAPRGPASHE